MRKVPIKKAAGKECLGSPVPRSRGRRAPACTAAPAGAGPLLGQRMYVLVLQIASVISLEGTLQTGVSSLSLIFYGRGGFPFSSFDNLIMFCILKLFLNVGILFRFSCIL